MRSLARPCFLHPTFPVRQHATQMLFQSYQRPNFNSKLAQFVARYLVNTTARRATGIARPQHLGQFRKTESNPKRPLNHQHPLHGALRIHPVTRRSPGRLGQDADPFVVSNRVGAYARCFGQCPGKKSSDLLMVRHAGLSTLEPIPKSRRFALHFVFQLRLFITLPLTLEHVQDRTIRLGGPRQERSIQ